MVRIFRPSKNSLTQLEIGALRKRQTYILVGHEEADDAWTPENVASVLLIKDKKLVSLVETNLFKMGYRVLPN